MLMRPLLLHSSKKAESPRRRRIIAPGVCYGRTAARPRMGGRLGVMVHRSLALSARQCALRCTNPRTIVIARIRRSSASDQLRT
jgi:hypothetical protein